MHLCPSQKRSPQSTQVVMSPNPKRWVSLHHSWDAGGRVVIDVCDEGVLLVELLVNEETVVEVEEREEVEEAEKKGVGEEV